MDEVSVYIMQKIKFFNVRESLEKTEPLVRPDPKENKVFQESFKRATKVQLESQAQTETLALLVIRSVEFIHHMFTLLRGDSMPKTLVR